MSHEDTGCARIYVVTQHQHDLFASVRVQRAGRLVGKNDRSVTDEAAGDGNPLTLASREPFWKAVSEVGDADFFERIHCCPTNLRRTDAIEL